MADLNRAIDIDPRGDADYYIRRGFIAFNLGLNDQAKQDYYKAVSIDPNNPGIALLRAFAFNEEDD